MRMSKQASATCQKTQKQQKQQNLESEPKKTTPGILVSNICTPVSNLSRYALEYLTTHRVKFQDPSDSVGLRIQSSLSSSIIEITKPTSNFNSRSKSYLLPHPHPLALHVVDQGMEKCLFLSQNLKKKNPLRWYPPTHHCDVLSSLGKKNKKKRQVYAAVNPNVEARVGLLPPLCDNEKNQLRRYNLHHNVQRI